MLFGTNGVRGKFNELTPDLALRIAVGIGVFFKRGKVLVARDGRMTGECLKNAVISGLLAAGCEVIDLDFASAPTAEFALKKLKGDGLVIVTASHNPPEWNALKVVDSNGVTVSRERGDEIEKLMRKAELAKWDEVRESSRYWEGGFEHIQEIKKLVQSSKFKGIKVVLDCGNGMASLIAPKLFRELGCEVVSINSDVDGRFPGRPSEPAEANLKELISSVKELKANCGIAWDGDGDRVVFVDENGTYIVGDKVYAIAVLGKLRNEKGDLVTTVATSKCIEDVGKKFGCKTVYTKIGAPYLSEEVFKRKALLGGEEVGGVIWPELSLAKDGFLTAAKIVEMIGEKPLSKWLEEVPAYHNEKLKINADEKRKAKIVQFVKDYAKRNRFEFSDVDGVRVNFKDCWVIVRASGTEPYVRIFAEAMQKEKAKGLVEEYKKLVENIR